MELWFAVICRPVMLSGTALEVVTLLVKFVIKIPLPQVGLECVP